ncbi:DegT/DnrJ/EryC1/StrS family aminotransferase [Candidatus Nitrosopelagicus sp.]|nr:DegT/DnrJ/EryC1/StrS family aminotransferase [Candidatus Nitrosopelagicus sp.]
MKKEIKLFDPSIDASEMNAVSKVLKSKFWASGSGNGLVKKFETQFQKYIKSKSCIAVNSGTAALNLAFSLFDIKNKEVILPSMSFVSSAHCIVEHGGIPIFVDIEPDTLCIDPKQIRKKISKKTVGILPVHFGGMPSNLTEIQKLAKPSNLFIVEDAAHAVGTKFNNQKIGSHGTIVCFSFHPVKNLAMPTGGLLAINHKNHNKLKDKLFSRRWCGITNRTFTDYDVHEIGWNYYMNEFSAAIGLEQLKKLDKLNKIRKKIAKKYFDEINITEKMPFSKDCSYHLYWILVKNRQDFRQKLARNGIETGTHYKPIHKMRMYPTSNKLPVTEKIGKEIVTIPIHPNLTSSDVNNIISKINRFI